MKFEKKDLFTIPNLLTYLRFLCLPFFVWMMAVFTVEKTNLYLYAGFGLFVFASVTDILDGFIARKYHMVSDIGKIIDPIADKLLQCLALLMLTIAGCVHWAFTVILVVKELYMGGMTEYFMRASDKQVNQQANVWGKVAASVNFSGIVLAFGAPLTKYLRYISIAVLAAGAVLTVVAAVQYTVRYARALEAYRAGKGDARSDDEAQDDAAQQDDAQDSADNGETR